MERLAEVTIDREAERGAPPGEVSLIEIGGFDSLVIVANLLQGLFRPRARAVSLATALDVDGRAVALLGAIRRAHGPGPVWVRAGVERALLVLGGDDARRVLEGSPYPFAPDPEAKRKGMTHFQPDALTLSRGELWEDRRRFTEAVLDSGRRRHRFADRFAAVAAAETNTLVASGRELRWEPWHTAFRRIARRLVLGDAATDDEHVSDLLATLMDEANRLPSAPSRRFEPFMARLTTYVEAAEAGSLVATFAGAPSDARTDTVGQVPHWLFALSDTLATNTYRALALLASHPGQRAKAREDADGGGLLLEACVEEAMRLWPTTKVLARVTLEDTDWGGTTVPAGTQVLISNTFNHRDPVAHTVADRFDPDAWTSGDARDDWTFNHLSNGPQRCAGAELALFVGSQVLAAVLAGHEPTLRRPTLHPDRPLPHMLDVSSVRIRLVARLEDQRGGEIAAG